MTIKPNNTDTKKSCWWIPLTMTTSATVDFTKTKAQSWLNCKNNSQTISLSKDDGWVIFNLQMAGEFLTINLEFLTSIN